MPTQLIITVITHTKHFLSEDLYTSHLHWRLGVIVVVQESREALNDGVGAGDLLGTSSCGNWWFAHDFSVS